MKKISTNEIHPDFYKGYSKAQEKIQNGEKIVRKVVSQCISPEYCEGWNYVVKHTYFLKNNA